MNIMNNMIIKNNKSILNIMNIMNIMNTMTFITNMAIMNIMNIFIQIDFQAMVCPARALFKLQLQMKL